MTSTACLRTRVVFTSLFVCCGRTPVNIVKLLRLPEGPFEIPELSACEVQVDEMDDEACMEAFEEKMSSKGRRIFREIGPKFVARYLLLCASPAPELNILMIQMSYYSI